MKHGRNVFIQKIAKNFFPKIHNKRSSPKAKYHIANVWANFWIFSLPYWFSTQIFGKIAKRVLWKAKKYLFYSTCETKNMTEKIWQQLLPVKALHASIDGCINVEN